MISVIVPVYNAEQYINRCVNSILTQTYSDWELILVDDGSIDNSLAQIKHYEDDKRVRIIHQENCGAGDARNRGIECITGDYVVFVDSDDYLEPDYFKLLSNHHEDIVFIDVNRRDISGRIIAEERLSVLKDKSKDDIIRGQMTGQILWGGVRKAVRRSLLERNNIRYSNHKVGEEAIYSFLLLYYAQDYSFISRPVYNYEIHSNSLSQTTDDDPWGPVANSLKETVIKLGCYKQYADSLNAFIITAAIVSLSKVASSLSFREFRKIAYTRMRATNAMIDSTYPTDYKHMNAKARILLPFIKLKLYSAVFLAAKIR